MDKYRMISKKGEGTFSEVLKCQNLKDGTYWACKKMKQHFNSSEELKDIREIQALRHLNGNPHILQLHEVIFERKTGTLNLIFELMDMNLYELIRTQRVYFSNKKVANYMLQLLKAIEHMHKFGYFHRDVKPENILIKDDLLKLADFGSVRRINTKHPYTEYISTRWYRAPENLLTDGYYSFPMDVWSCGCVMFELMTLHPLFPGSNEIDQIDKIHDILGTPADPTILEKFKQRSRNIRFNFKPKKGIGISRYMPNFPKEAIDLITQLCTYDPDHRISAHRALKHKYFNFLRETVKENSEIRTPATDIDSGRRSMQTEQIILEANSALGLHPIDNTNVVEIYKPIFKKNKKIAIKSQYNPNNLVNRQSLLISQLNNNSKVNSNFNSYSMLGQYSDIDLSNPSVQFQTKFNQGIMLPKLSNSMNSLAYSTYPTPTHKVLTTVHNQNVLPNLFNSSQNGHHLGGPKMH